MLPNYETSTQLPYTVLENLITNIIIRAELCIVIRNVCQPAPLGTRQFSSVFCSFPFVKMVFFFFNGYFHRYYVNHVDTHNKLGRTLLTWITDRDWPYKYKKRVKFVPTFLKCVCYIHLQSKELYLYNLRGC